MSVENRRFFLPTRVSSLVEVTLQEFRQDLWRQKTIDFLSHHVYNVVGRSFAVSVSVCLSICLFVCLSVRSHAAKSQVQSSRNFLCLLCVAVARSSSDGSPICCVLSSCLCDDRYSYFNVISAYRRTDRQTDRHKELLNQYRALHYCAMRTREISEYIITPGGLKTGPLRLTVHVFKERLDQFA